MDSLSAIRDVLKNDADVASYATGGIFFLQVDQGAERPNVMLMTVSGADDWTHQGPDGLHQDLIRIYSRADTYQHATELARRVRAALNGYIGSKFGIDVQLTQFLNTTGDYQDAAKIYRQIEDFRVTYRLP
jgi:hypothetical protein